MSTTADDVWQLLAELTAAQKETDQQLKEVSQQQKENAQQQKKTDRQLKELCKQIGGLGSKFGSFTEGLAHPSMKRLLTCPMNSAKKSCKKGFLWLVFTIRFLNSIFLMIFNFKVISFLGLNAIAFPSCKKAIYL